LLLPLFTIIDFIIFKEYFHLLNMLYDLTQFGAVYDQ